jgi:hypothetical protein
VDKRQFVMLGIGLFLGSLAIGVGAAHKAEEQRKEKARDQAEAKQQAEAEQDRPLDRPKDLKSASPIERDEKVGIFQLRVTESGRAGLFSAAGDVVAEVDGFQGARALEKARLFDGPLVELIGKDCEDPCNPTLVVAGTVKGKPIVALRARGVAKLDDLDHDGVPEAVVDHLMDGTQEMVTLPFKLKGDRFEPAYQAFPDGVDRQLDSLGKAAERICTAEVEEECRWTLEAILGLSAFQAPGSAAQAIGHLKIDPAAKEWARDGERVEKVAREMADIVEH